MDNSTNLFIWAAAAYYWMVMATVCVESRKRKRRTTISYGPIDERDRMRIEYLDNKIWKDEITCVNMVRLGRGAFFRFCKLFRDRGLLRDTIHMCVEQQVAMFLNTIGHNLRNRLVGTNFDRSGETVSRYFNLVLRAIGEEDDGLISTLTRVGDKLAMAIENAGAKSAPPQDDIPENLFETLQSLPGFDETQISHYFAHLVENPRSARAFMKLPYIGQLTWVARYISKEFHV